MVGGALEVNRYLSVIMELVDEGKGFYAYGTQTGTGKTTMACLALRAYLYGSLSRAPYNLENRRVLYLNVPEFLDSLRRSYNREDLELESLIDELLDINRSPRLIVLDDLGAEKSSEWVMERLYSIINFRVSNKLAIIVTSNLSLDELEVKLGPRITSRLRGCCKQVKFEGKDHRRCNW
jgi:DNA replication protein DnaC